MKVIITLILLLGFITDMDLFTQAPGKISVTNESRGVYIHPNKKTHVFYSQCEAFLILPNRRVYPSNMDQSETIIVRHPLNQNILFASCNIRSSFFFSEGMYVSTNSGINWTGKDTLEGLPLNSHSGDPGIVIDKNGRFIITHIGAGALHGMASNYSTDNGLTWSNTLQIEGGDLAQHVPKCSSDDTPWSQYYGRSYTVYTSYIGTPHIRFVYTTNGAESWSTPVTISPVSLPGRFAAMSDIPARTGPNGEVYVIWNNFIDSGINNIPDSIGFGRSTDGGISWQNTSNSHFNINGIPDGNVINGVRYSHFPRIDVDRSGGPRNGWIYVVTDEKDVSPATDLADVILYRSTNGGDTWSQGIRVNQDTPGNGKYQLLPAIRVDEASNINIIYYDSRNTPSNDSLEVYISRSTDGGNTWVDILISDHKFKPQAGYFGEYIGITSANGKIWPLWMDNSTGVMQAWTTGIDVINAVEPGNTLPEHFLLKQNYPNPFNPSTKIRFDIPVQGYASLKIFDILGRVVSAPVEEVLKPGSYEIEWNAEELPSGVYFYRIQTDEYSAMKKMVLVK